MTESTMSGTLARSMREVMSEEASTKVTLCLFEVRTVIGPFISFMFWPV